MPCRVWLIDFDQRLFEYLTLYANPPWVTWLCEHIGDMRTYIAPALLFLALYIWQKRWSAIRFLLILIFYLVLSEVVAHFMKIAVARPRPAVAWLIYTDPTALGFPSAHAVNTMALAVFLAKWFRKSLLWFLAIPFVVGVSRVFANYHYPLDVVAGWATGYFFAILFWKLVPQRFMGAAEAL
ncbi:MAG: hypothetical protein LDLANPLL_00567 [Turneriella sp.]|nr:hypothetical protein [Turneriella sp.]